MLWYKVYLDFLFWIVIPSSFVEIWIVHLMEVLFSLEIEKRCSRNISLIFCQCSCHVLHWHLGSFIPFDSYCGTPIFFPYEKLGKFCLGSISFACFLVSCILFMVIHSSDASTWRHINDSRFAVHCKSGKISVWRIHLICSSLSI